MKLPSHHWQSRSFALKSILLCFVVCDVDIVFGEVWGFLGAVKLELALPLLASPINLRLSQDGHGKEIKIQASVVLLSIAHSNSTI
jgi:hypothetical protein